MNDHHREALAWWWSRLYFKIFSSILTKGTICGGSYECQYGFFEMCQTLRISYIGIEVGPFTYSWREKTIFKIVVRFNIKRGILFCVICVLSCQLVLIERGTWENDFSLFWKENSFLYHRCCCTDSKPRSWWSFFRELPLTAPAMQVLHYIESIRAFE